ncbi:MAG: 1-(5-phosphoribosyl)-5-[(5-phosphoribosylamino)methylideneamino]imidazole-4-carboxamide isomerase [Candidatus Omnitrophica bacterium]|nr:1-(5-phosphoribosyl)-5-[(5-phosphoribosylamino)methylideneamino]imidazole-4-carboxamide isomerase [Candidatus Omnitrophota bacterium]
MILFPAIDIKSGKVVRLIQGKFDQVTEYSNDPVSMAKHWEDQGAKWLHVVDLDGAKSGEIKNRDIILKIAQAVGIPVQMGGGIRTKEDVSFLIEGGIARVVLGTRVIEDTTFLLDLLSTWNEKIAVSLDCSGGYVAQNGWTMTSNIRGIDLVREFELLGLKYLIYTDIASDGTLSGPNFEGLKSILAATQIPVIASGGIADLDDVKRLKSLENRGVIGAITGKAIYEGKLDFKKALMIC